MEKNSTFYSQCLNASLAPEDCKREALLENLIPTMVGIGGSFLNACLIIIIVFNRGKWTASNLLICNKGVADLLLNIFGVQYKAMEHVMPTWYCKFVRYSLTATVYPSVYTSVLISLDRFMAVDVYPIRSILIKTEKNALLAITILWSVTLTTTIPVGIYEYNGKHKYSSNYNDYWSGVFLSDYTTRMIFQISFAITTYIFPLILLVMFYTGMLRRLWKSAPGCRMSAERMRRRKSVTKMAVVVVVAFAVCWGPIQIILLLKALDASSINRFTLTVQIVSQVLAIMSSWVNPFLYVFMSENCRVDLMRVNYGQYCDDVCAAQPSPTQQNSMRMTTF